MKIAAWIFGALATVAIVAAYQQKTRKGLIVAKFCSDLLQATHYALLGAYAGMIPQLVAAVREIVFSRREGAKWENNLLVPVVFVVISWGLTLRNFQGVADLLPLTASTSVTFLLWGRTFRRTKIGLAPASVCFLIYNAIVGSWTGIFNEILGLGSIVVYLIKSKGEKEMQKNENLFTPDEGESKDGVLTPGAPIEDYAAMISSNVNEEAKEKGARFAEEIEEKFFSDFEKSEQLLALGKVEKVDQMVHVSTFMTIDGMVYMTYYANTDEASEDPEHQTARLAYCPVDKPDEKTFLDVQSVGDTCGGLPVRLVYDTILARVDEDTLFVLWTAKVGDTYYRLYRPFSLSKKEFGEIGVNRFAVGKLVNDFSTTGMQAAMTANGIAYKIMYSDIGIMQKFSTRQENGETYYYTGAYSGDFTCIIKSKDFVTWEYVAQPDFPNESKWENATYVLGDTCYYFVRQQQEVKYGFLTAYHLDTGVWEKPVLIEDCQSRGDFIFYRGELYLFHAPIDREHIGIVKVNTKRLQDSEVVLQAPIHTSCFYPFVQYFDGEELAMSYTVERKHIRLARFILEKYL